MASLDLAGFVGHVEAGYRVVPLTRTLQLDRETPVSLYQRFADGRAFFLLESAALGEQTGRYSFIGLDRLWRVTTRDGNVHCEGATAPDSAGAPLKLVRDLLARHRAPHPPDLPDLTGGAVGFVSYDYVRSLERLERAPEENPWPDVDFSFPGAVLICDHLRHSTTVVVNVVVHDDAPALAFDAGVERLEGIVDTLLSPAPA